MTLHTFTDDELKDLIQRIHKREKEKFDSRTDLTADDVVQVIVFWVEDIDK